MSLKEPTLEEAAIWLAQCERDVAAKIEAFDQAQAHLNEYGEDLVRLNKLRSEARAQVMSIARKEQP